MSTASDSDLSDVRRRLHRCAEPSGQEAETAALVATELERLRPDSLLRDLGGHGVAATFGAARSPTVLVRSDMDALPVADDPSLPHASRRADTAHACGHDGHMAALLGLARRLANDRPSSGPVVLLFQPAEEVGAGARAVLDDPAFADCVPDVAIAMHNLPGYPLGTVVVRAGPFASASRGMTIEFVGRRSHASEPHRGRSPVAPMCALARDLAVLPQSVTAFEDAAQVTVVGLQIGGPAFGTSPGDGRLMATLRAHRTEVIDRLAQRATRLARGLADGHQLQCSIDWTDEFPATTNDARVVARLRDAARHLSLEVVEPEHPFAWSEDFGHFTATVPGALFGLGSGIDQPALHAPGYDFPDALLTPACDLFERFVRDYLAQPSLTTQPEVQA